MVSGMDIVPGRVLPCNRLANVDVPLHRVANFREFEVKKIFVQLTPNNSNLQGKSKKVRVIGSSKKIAGSKEKNSFYCTVSILITFNCRNVE